MKILREKKIFRRKKEKKSIPLVFQNEEISLWPELSSSPSFRIQGGGYLEHDKQIMDKGPKSLCLIFYSKKYIMYCFKSIV